ncbi:hypothetical protein Athai_29090 [Actinocatenispora thailandica]|uniref:Uncharacterized protein n=1 Tax=Actinocatenispora thailandica TaxID=227318 RepID=A0A7R7HX67_9ACTN|nr:hypothetical protein [Actinocatenispora thailandica]BCJ35406.1 hypothetical protein Athai_29090 [Actinocatenispora thailandica]
MAVDPERRSEQRREAKEQARRTSERAQRQAERLRQASRAPDQQQEWVRQNNLIYGGLIAVGLVLVQPFLTASSLNRSATVCVLAFSVAIPLLAALVLVSRQEDFRRRTSDSRLVRLSRAVAQLLGFVGVVAGFWHIRWYAGVAVLASGVVAMMVHSAGHFRLEVAAAEESPPSPDGTDGTDGTDG